MLPPSFPRFKDDSPSFLYRRTNFAERIVIVEKFPPFPLLAGPLFFLSSSASPASSSSDYSCLFRQYRDPSPSSFPEPGFVERYCVSSLGRRSLVFFHRQKVFSPDHFSGIDPIPHQILLHRTLLGLELSSRKALAAALDFLVENVLLPPKPLGFPFSFFKGFEKPLLGELVIVLFFFLFVKGDRFSQFGGFPPRDSLVVLRPSVEV